MPDPDESATLPPGPTGNERPPRPPLRFPNAYTWLIFVSAMDLMLTWGIVFVLGGVEANPLAAHIIHLAGFTGLIIFKFGVMLAVIGVCEFIARHAIDTARKLAVVAVGISAFPILWSMLLIAQIARQ